MTRHTNGHVILFSFLELFRRRLRRFLGAGELRSEGERNDCDDESFHCLKWPHHFAGGGKLRSSASVHGAVRPANSLRTAVTNSGVTPLSSLFPKELRT